MSPCEQLRQKLLENLQIGVKYTLNGEEIYIGYNTLLKHYCTATVPRTLFLDKYKSVVPIEAFSREEKNQWKAFVNEIFHGTTPQFRLEAVKIIHVIGILTN